MKNLTLALVGNPNCGKTTLFNVLTGAKQCIGNWPGVTVEQKQGFFKIGNLNIEVVDLPGCYSCIEDTQNNKALDEHIACDYILSNKADIILNVIDATNLERHLYLTLQLIEGGYPVIVVLNLMDSAHKQNIQLNKAELEKRLNCPVIPITATKEEGIQALKTGIIQYAEKNTRPIVSSSTPSSFCLGELDSDIAVARTRYDSIFNIIKAAVFRKPVSYQAEASWTKSIDNIVLNRFLGIPVFLSLMYLMFLLAIYMGGPIQAFFDTASRILFIDILKQWLTGLNADPYLISFVTSGIGRGLNTVVSFIPVMTGLFFCLSFLEASGYMTRAAFVMDKLMHWIGLSGRSFVPLILGFGCNVPAILSTRTLESHRERLLTILMSPFMSCGARLAIYAVFVSVFFENQGPNIIFGLYLIGILVAFMTGFILRKTAVSFERSSLVMELPPYRWPSLKVLFRTTIHRLKRFIVKAGALILPICMLMGTFEGMQTQTNGFVETVGRTLTPIFSPMGIEEENWPATVGLLTGVLAKEVVIGTLNTLYDQQAREAAIEESEATPVLGMMAKQFGSTEAAFAYLLFVLLYFPCVSVLATIARELNKGWALFSMLWTTGIAYCVAVLFYQTATFMLHPLYSFSWILSIGIIITMAFWTLRKWVNKKTLGPGRHVPTQILVVDF